IADENKPVALAGVMGGVDSEVTEETQTILLESATFHASNIRRTAAQFKSRTEASTRFEKGLSPELAMVASQRATKLLVELAGGRALHGLVDNYPAPVKEVRIDVTRRRLEQVLGVDLPTSTVREALTSLGFGCKWEPPEHYQVRVPYWRTDVDIPDDIAEEVARIVGYDQIPTKNLGGDVPPAIPQPLRDLRERLRDALAAAGMQEIITYSLTTSEELERVLPEGQLEQLLKVVNPLSAEHEYLRPVLRGSVLKTLAANVRQRESEIALFEASRVYLPRSGELPEEQEHIVGVVTGKRDDRWGRSSDEPVDFYDAKGYVQAALQAAGVEGTFEAAEEFGLLPGRTAVVSAAGAKVGVIGQLHPSVASSFGIDQDVYLFELVVDHLLPAVQAGVGYAPLMRFPAVVQDIALVVDSSQPAEDVRRLIERHELVRAVRVFDVYEGEGVPADRKSLAFSVTYQSAEKTLTDEEVARAQSEILKSLSEELNAELRA
ncbi:MAG: phenylalanine--tRNA ligase subunit beta, partial [Chloroflexi bacterium]|nr:phenylalanine--tRNA ligase subunit beta [Chloroflexota bacterium]